MRNFYLQQTRKCNFIISVIYDAISRYTKLVIYVVPIIYGLFLSRRKNERKQILFSSLLTLLIPFILFVISNPSQAQTIDVDSVFTKPSVLANVYFTRKGFEIQPVSLRQLEKLTQTLKRNPSVLIAFEVNTDRLCSPKINKYILEKRILELKEYFIQENEIDSSRIFIKSMNILNTNNNNTAKSSLYDNSVKIYFYINKK